MSLSRWAPRRVGVGLLAGLLLSCAQVRQELPGPDPVVVQRNFAQGRGSLDRLAVMPFYPAATLARRPEGEGPSPAEAAALVTRFVNEAIAARGVRVIPASDLETAFGGDGMVVPRLNAREAAEQASRSFGATGVLLGQVIRYRERSGQALGSGQPASVGFEVTLHEAPSGFKLWTSRFLETQRPLSDNLFNARRYPGGGTRWLTAAELARWGADATAAALVNRP